MDANHLEKYVEAKAKRRAKKRKPTMRMSGKHTREIPRLWRKRSGH